MYLGIFPLLIIIWILRVSEKDYSRCLQVKVPLVSSTKTLLEQFLSNSIRDHMNIRVIKVPNRLVVHIWIGFEELNVLLNIRVIFVNLLSVLIETAVVVFKLKNIDIGSVHSFVWVGYDLLSFTFIFRKTQWQWCRWYNFVNKTKHAIANTWLLQVQLTVKSVNLLSGQNIRLSHQSKYCQNIWLAFSRCNPVDCHNLCCFCLGFLLSTACCAVFSISGWIQISSQNNRSFRQSLSMISTRGFARCKWEIQTPSLYARDDDDMFQINVSRMEKMLKWSCFDQLCVNFPYLYTSIWTKHTQLIGSVWSILAQSPRI